MAPEQLYDGIETGSAFTALAEIVVRLPEPFLLLGGWAVYVTVNDSFRDAQGSNYLGSRDIDICFQINPECSEEELRNCTFSQALNVIREIGYTPYGSYRYCKIIRRDTREIIDEDTARQFGMHELFYLYIDVMVDRIHPRHREVFGFNVLDEPLIREAFEEGAGHTVNLEGVELLIPSPALLLATKLRSIPNRPGNDKLVKDACDIYAILWHSPMAYSAILAEIRLQYPDECERGYAAITNEIAESAARHLGIDVETYKNVIRGLVER
jgi:hypothetical protein